MRGGAGPLQGLVLDLSTVSFMDSAGIGVLVCVYQRATADRIPLLLAGAPAQARRLLQITGLDCVFAMRPSLEEALLHPLADPSATSMTLHGPSALEHDAAPATLAVTSAASSQGDARR